MQRFLGAVVFVGSLVCALGACGGAVKFDEPATVDPARDGASVASVGWSALSPAPAEVLGALTLKLEGENVISGAFRPASGATPPKNLVVVVRWEGPDPIVHTVGVVTPSQASTFRGSLGQVPCGTSEKLRGMLLVYATDDDVSDVAAVERSGMLVGVSYRDAELFRDASPYNFELANAVCGRSSPRWLPPIPLTRDPRHTLALCASGETGPVRCGKPVFPEVRIDAPTAAVDPTGAVRLTFPPEYGSPDLAPRITINGVTVPEARGDRWSVELPSRDAPPLRRGVNEIVVALPGSAPWRAKLVLPEENLDVRVSSLRVGERFTVETDNLAWARHYDVALWPADIGPTRAGQYLHSEAPRAEDVFAGFTVAGRTHPSRVGVQLTATSGRRGPTVTQTARTEVLLAEP